MLTVTEYRDLVLDAVEPAPPAPVAVTDPAALLGLVTAAPLVSQAHLPPFTNSAMDGYAVRAADTAKAPLTLPVAGDIPAGDTRQLALKPGAAYRIMTGAPLPAGADAVVQVEHTDGGLARVRIDEQVRPGTAVRNRGEDVTPGMVVLPASTRLAARHLPIVVSSGAAEISVHPRPRLAVVSTGDELRPAGSALEHGQIIDSNGPMIAALALECGFDVAALQHIGDTGEQTRDVLRDLAGRADAIVTSGGVSAGAFEPLRLAFEADGQMEFVKVAMQPGKPQALGHLGDTPVFGLPGNPVSSLVSFLLFVAPALRKMAGRPADVPTRTCQVAAGWRPAAPGRTQIARVRLLPDGRIEPAGGAGSHLLGGLAASDALAVVPDDVTQVSHGDLLEVLDYPGERILHG